MQRFQELLTEAAQLKESQLKNERKNYESLPDYLKAGLNYAKKFEVLRKQNYLIQMNLSEKLKKQGNNFFKKEQYDQALAKYQEALSIFRYVIATSYENMKDEDLQYKSFCLDQSLDKYQEEYSSHLTALYLNICSCLTKKNKKEDAIHSADQALKIKETAKAYYKKAQTYLQFINRENSDVKLGFYYLNKCYQISKDQSVVQEMHRVKKELDDQRNKEKTWFKFMFDKNSQNNPKPAELEKVNQVKQPQQKKVEVRSEKLKKLEEEKGRKKQEKQDQKLQKTKEKLAKYLNLDLKEQVWKQCYQGEFVSKHGSKIYSIIQLYGYKELLGEYRVLLAHCLESTKQGAAERRRQAYLKYFQWLKCHPIAQIAKYLERYDLQTKWIREQRNKMAVLRQKERRLELQKAELQASEMWKNEALQTQLKLQQNKQESEEVSHQKIQNLNQKSQISQQTEVLMEQINKMNQTKVQSNKLHTQTQPQVASSHQENNYPKENSKIKYLSFALAFLIIIIIRFLL